MCKQLSGYGDMRQNGETAGRIIFYNLFICKVSCKLQTECVLAIQRHALRHNL